MMVTQVTLHRQIANINVVVMEAQRKTHRLANESINAIE
jgi:hypothetical protein